MILRESSFLLSVEFTTSDEVIVIHGQRFQPRKMFLFTEHGDFIKVIRQHLINPWSVSVRDDGYMIVCDWGDDSVKVLSPDGTGLVQSFKEPHSFGRPTSAVYHDNKFFVSIDSHNYVTVFNNEGLYLYDNGKESVVGSLSKNLAVDSFNNLIVCSCDKSSLHVFSLDGK